MKERVIAIGLLIAAAVTALVLWLKRKEGEPIPPSPGLATLWGIVSDADTGKAIEEVGATLDSSAVITCVKGRYEFTEVQPRAYTVTFLHTLYEKHVEKITLTTGLNRLDVKLSRSTSTLRGKIADDSGKEIQQASVKCNSKSTTTDSEGDYHITKLAPGLHTVVISKPLYETVTKEVTLSPGLATTLNIFLTKSPATTPTVRWMRVRPAIVTVGEKVEIDCECVCYTPGTYPVECVIDGVTKTQEYTFRELQVWSTGMYKFTPTQARTYTATILGVSKTFEVKEAVIANLKCPYCEETHLCLWFYNDTWHVKPEIGFPPAGRCTEERCAEANGQWRPISSESFLVEHIADYGHTISGDPCSDWVDIHCPYCDWKLKLQAEFGWKSPRIQLAWGVVDHIKEVHPSEWKALHW